MSSPGAIEIPLIKANNQNLKGYGYLVDNFDRCKIEIITWPKQGCPKRIRNLAKRHPKLKFHASFRQAS